MMIIDGLSKMSAFVAKTDNIKVMHQQTCPTCGKTLVNIYKNGEVWKCRRCWERRDEK